jgi:HNH endonuclease
MNRKSLKRLRAAAFKRQHGSCCYCRKPMWIDDCAAFAAAHRLTLRQARRRQCTAEHLLARHDGGGDTRSNIAAACLECNLTRHRRKAPPPPPQWGAIRSGRAVRSAMRRPTLMDRARSDIRQRRVLDLPRTVALVPS